MSHEDSDVIEVDSEGDEEGLVEDMTNPESDVDMLADEPAATSSTTLLRTSWPSVRQGGPSQTIFSLDSREATICSFPKCKRELIERGFKMCLHHREQTRIYSRERNERKRNECVLHRSLFLPVCSGADMKALTGPQTNELPTTPLFHPGSAP